MQVTRQRSAFEAITITLETVNEAMAVTDVMQAYLNERESEGFVEKSKTPKDGIVSNLLSALRKMGY